MEPTPHAQGRWPLTFSDEIDDGLRADPDCFAEPERLVEAERRRAARAPVHRPVWVDLGNGPVECVLVDVSATGFALRLPRSEPEPPIGLGFVADVVVDAGTARVTAEVVRTDQRPGLGSTVGARLTSGSESFARCLLTP